MTRFDPHGRPISRQGVPLEVARALKDQAEAALREIHRLRQAAAVTEEALRQREAELDRALDEVHALRQRLERETPGQAARAPEPVEVDDRVARLSADLANVRRHRDDEVERARREGQAEGLVALADAADDLRRALEAAPTEGPWFDGLSRLLARVRGRLDATGAVEIGVVGERFDPARHEAIGLQPGEADTVVHVGRTGLVAPDGSLIRAASVVVGQG